MYRLFDVCKRSEASKTGLRGWNVPASTTAALCNKLGSNCPSCACRLGTWGNQVRGSLRMNQDGNRQGLTEDAPQSSDAFGQKKQAFVELRRTAHRPHRSEEHTSELQSLRH